MTKYKGLAIRSGIIEKMQFRGQYWKHDQPSLAEELGVNGTWGWVGLALYVWLWDLLARETLSRTLWRGLEHPKKRWVVVVAWLWVTSHLLLKRPAKLLIKW